MIFNFTLVKSIARAVRAILVRGHRVERSVWTWAVMNYLFNNYNIILLLLYI